MSLILTRRRATASGGAALPPWDGSTPATGSRCTVPTYDGSGQSVHPSVVDMGQDGWCGYRWWFADTPFPGGNTRLENPCIWGSRDRITWEVPHGLVNPIELAPPAPGYNSDTELVWDPDEGRMVCYWRRLAGNILDIRAAWSANGNSWHDHATIIPALTSHPTATGGVVSPSIVRVGPGDWRLYFWGGLGLWTAPTALGPWTFQEAGIRDDGPQAWHGDIIRYQDRWIGVYSDSATKRDLYPVASPDGLTWTTGPKLTAVVGYRPTITISPEAGHIDLWGSNVVTHYHRLADTIWTDLLP